MIVTQNTKDDPRSLRGQDGEARKVTASTANIRIVELVEKTHLLDNIIKHITNGSNDPDLMDLSQDIYISLLVDAKLSGIYERGELNFYLARLVMNNIASSTSPYYRIYKRPKLISDPISKAVMNIPE